MKKEIIRPITIFIGLFETEMDFGAVFEQCDMSEYFDAETGEYLKPSCELSKVFGFNSYDDDWVDYEFLEKATHPCNFYEALLESHEESRFDYWNLSIMKQAIDYCVQSKVEKVNSILQIGELDAWEIVTNKYEKIGKDFPIMYCGTYNETTGEEVFD